MWLRALLRFVLAFLAAGCSEDGGSLAAEPLEQTPPPFAYSLYLEQTEQGPRLIKGSDVLLTHRPEHLEHVYRQRDSEHDAKVLFAKVEEQFRWTGVAFANMTALACGLDLPIRCTPDWQFIDGVLGHSDGPGARHLRQVLADAFTAQARKRRLETTLAMAIANAVLARGQLKAAVGKAAVSAETRAALGTSSRAASVEGAALRAEEMTAVEQSAAAVGAERLAVTGRIRARPDVSAMQARIPESCRL